MRFTFICFLTAFSLHVNADIVSEMAQCGQLHNDKHRLQCFDAIQHDLAIKPTAEIVVPATSRDIEPSTPNQTRQVLTDDTPTNADSTSNNSPQTIVLTVEKQEAIFGKKNNELNIITKINSTIEGDFRGWVKDQIITLANGQKWKVVSSSRGYIKLSNPEVEISEGFWGSYDMQVSGFKPFAKVKRIK